MSEGPRIVNKRKQRYWIKTAIYGVLLVALLIGMYFSTAVRSVSENDAASPEERDPKEYAAEIYEPTIAPYVDENAVDIVELQKAIAKDLDAAGEEYGKRDGDNAAWAFPVTLTGVVGEKELNLVPITVDGFPGDITLYLQIGPIYGSALRDVSGEFPFGIFANQDDAKFVGDELNNLAKEAVFSDVDAGEMTGKTVTLKGAITVPKNATTYEIVATQLEVG